MFKHSTGPWRLGRLSKRGNYQYIDAEHGNWYEFAKVCISVSGEPSKEGEANARVIVAAPDMLDALMQWQDAERTGDIIEIRNARLSRDMAINKALGRQIEV